MSEVDADLEQSLSFLFSFQRYIKHGLQTHYLYTN